MRAIALALTGAMACCLSQGAQAVLNCGPAGPQAHTNISALGGGGYQYIINITGSGSPFLVCGAPLEQVTDFYIPYFADMGIDTSSPDFSGTYVGYDIEADSIFGLGGQVLHYRFSSGVNAGVLQHVEFDAAFAGAEAPFESDLVDSNGNRTVFMGDPLIPGSPELLAALDATSSVSEPGALAIFFSGLALMLVARRARRVPVRALAAVA